MELVLQDIKIKKIKKLDELPAEKIVIEVMRHFGFRRNYQVAEYFEVTPQTLSGWIKSGEIPLKHRIKFSSDLNSDEINKNNQSNSAFINKKQFNYEIEKKTLPINKILNDLKSNIKTIVICTLLSISLSAFYVFYVADPVYTSKSKVLPVSEDGSTTSSFSGLASQLGVNMPINIGGKVPWDEIYPEILKSRDLLETILPNKYETMKYGNMTLYDIMKNEKNLESFPPQEQKNRIITKLSDMIIIKKDRSSPIVNIDVNAFEPEFAANFSKDLISKSSLVQRQLKTSRIKQKRLFIEERLDQVLYDMKLMEEELRQFRENNRNLSSSPSLQMKVQEMGRERDLQSSLYVTLKTQYEKAKIDEVGRDDMVQQIDGPSIPTHLTKPKRLLSLIFSLFFGLCLSFFLIYFKEKIILE